MQHQIKSNHEHNWSDGANWVCEFYLFIYK
jgi:hypothetical protein